VSPFLESQPTIVDEATDRPLQISQSVKVIPGMMLDPIRPEHFSMLTVSEAEPGMKYSNSIQQLKTLREQKEEEPQRIPRKGTALYLKELLERQKNNA
jgi:hypothetical protein